MKISVITPTIRPEGLNIIQSSLANQTFKDFEWLVEVGLKTEHDLNKAFNKMIKRAKGELLVFLEDYTKVPPDYLQKWWDAYQKYPDTFFTAPLGKVDNLEYKPPARWDWRAWKHKESDGDFIDGKWDCWEIDNGACPKACLYAIGGFDEELDAFWSCDNLNVGCRADIARYKFLNYFGNPAIAYDHDAFMPHPFRERFKPIFNNERMKEFRNGLKIDYLQDSSS
jgi:hypothetical protein